MLKKVSLGKNPHSDQSLSINVMPTVINVSILRCLVVFSETNWQEVRPSTAVTGRCYRPLHNFLHNWIIDAICFQFNKITVNMQVCEHTHFRHMIHCFDFKMTVMQLVYLRFITKKQQSNNNTFTVIQHYMRNSPSNVNKVFQCKNLHSRQ